MKIAYFAPIYYDYIKQRPQHLAELLSKNHEVYYIEPTISAMRFWLKGGRSYQAYSHGISPKLNIIRANGLFTVHKSLEYFDVFNLNTVSEFRQLCDLVESCDLIWVGYSGWYSLIERFVSKKIVYDKMDDDSEIAKNPLLKKLLKDYEKKLIDCSAVVFVSCGKFYNDMVALKKKVYLIRNGVSIEFPFYNDKHKCKKAGEKRIFGYVGTISHWFDFDVLRIILDENENNEIIMVGPNQMPEFQHKRVRYVGVVAKEKLGSIISQFDVCLYPFKRTGLLDTINPVKIYEYLAMNKPVLAVASMETEVYEDKLWLYKNAEDIMRFLNKKEFKPFSSEIELRKFIEANSWESRTEKIEEILYQYIY